MRALQAIVLLIVVTASAAGATRFVPAAREDSRPSTAPKAASPDIGTVQAVSRPTIEARQAPVPIRWTYKHVAVTTPEERGLTIDDLVTQASKVDNQAGTVDSQASTVDNQASTVDNQASTVDGATIGQAAAKAAIEADGYKSVRDLAKAPNGRWTARALRGATEIAVSVAADGSVSAN
jgi:adhesin HecA-like repeat protein